MDRIDIESVGGPMVLAAQPHGLAGAWFRDQPHFSAEVQRWPQRRAEPLTNAEAEFKAYLAGELTEFDLPLAPRGTPFQRQVWEYLRAIGYGQSSTYSQVARALGRPSAARAVGTAVGRNQK